MTLTMTSEFEGKRRYGKPGARVTVWAPPLTIQELATEETDLVSELIESFTVDMQRRLQRIREAMSTSNVLVLRSEVHTIKGSSKQMAADRVASVCEQIEAADRERPMSQLGDLVRQLEVRLREVCDAMAWYQLSSRKKAS
jgi:HPt (histidine-containing phosphotransfer) domain-containing protein